MLLGDRFQPANAGADEYADFIPIDAFEVEARVAQRLPAGVDSELEKRSVRRISLGEGKAGPGLKFLTSAAIWVSKPEASKELMRSTPH